MAREYTLGEAKKLILHLAKTNYEINSKSNNRAASMLAINLEGSHGIGKSTLLQDITNSSNYGFAKIVLPNYTDETIFTGYPSKVFELNKKVESKNAEGATITKTTKITVPESLIQNYLVNRDIYSLAQTEPMLSYSLPQWYHKLANKERGILFIDEYNRALPHMIDAVMELVNSGKYGTYELPAGTLIVLASNPAEGKYNVKSVDVASKTRYFTIKVKFDKAEWLEWADRSNLADVCINYVKLTPEVMTTDNISPREWSKFFLSISTIPDMDAPENLELIEMLGQASVGDKVLNFVMFVKNNLHIIPSMNEIFTEPLTQKVIDKLKASIKDPNTGHERADIKGLIGMRLMNYIKSRRKHEMTTLFQDRIVSIIENNLLGRDSVHMLFTNIEYDDPASKNLMLNLATSENIRKYII